MWFRRLWGKAAITDSRLVAVDMQAGLIAPYGNASESPTLTLSRRGFLQGLGGMALAAPLLLEELLHLESKTFFLPPIGGWASSTIDVWSVNSLGGFYYSRELAKILRTSFHTHHLKWL
jgi:hypothetical protein